MGSDEHEPSSIGNDIDITPSEEDMWIEIASGIYFNDCVTWDNKLFYNKLRVFYNKLLTE